MRTVLALVIALTTFTACEKKGPVVEAADASVNEPVLTEKEVVQKVVKEVEKEMAEAKPAVLQSVPQAEVVDAGVATPTVVQEKK